MRTLKEIREAYESTRIQLEKEYEETLQQLIIDSGLSGDLVSVKTGKKGKLLIEHDRLSTFPILGFHLYTKSGELSVNKSLDDFIWMSSNILVNDLKSMFVKA